MIAVLVALLVIVVLAGTVVVYVAYPRRGEDVPNAPWVGEALRRGVAKLPTLDNRGDERSYGRAPAGRGSR